MNTQNLPEASALDINNVIFQWLMARNMFTNYDIIKELRPLGYHVLHEDVKDEVENTGMLPNYTKTLIDVRGRKAFLFHPQGTNPNDYIENGVPDFGVNTNGMTASVQPANQPMVTISMFDKRNRYSRHFHSHFIWWEVRR